MIILYADDDSDDREIFAEILEEIDPEISIVEASDGRETINILAQGILPDLINDRAVCLRLTAQMKSNIQKGYNV